MLKDPDMQEIVDSFIVESKEILENLDRDLVELENSPEDDELLNSIFRSFHTIKGTSGFLGLEKLPRLTHKCEDILNKLRKREAVLDSDLMDGILRGYDVIKALVNDIDTKKSEDADIEQTLVLLEELYEVILDPEKKVKVTEEPVEEKKEKSEKKTVPGSTDSKKKPKETEREDNVSIKENSIRVDVERLDELLNMVSELVLGRNQLAQLNNEFGLEYEGTKHARDLSETARQIDLLTNELQLVVMKTRMVKIGKIFNRFPRLVRDLSKGSGKKINLLIDGEETELDKTLVEEIYDPLVHLIRNSADHGIEMPEERVEAGKDETGTISLNAEHEGNNIVIRIEDDGKGINTEKIKRSAVEKGLITEEKARELSTKDVYNLIFLPGFSTAEKVTNVSGRGVGMDVVKTNVLKLRGSIEIDSEVGKGTTIKIKLPLTLAIIHGMLVRVKNEIIVIPLNAVMEVVRTHQDDIFTIKRKEVIRYRDTTIPLLSIDNLLNKYSTEEEYNIWQYVVIVRIAEKIFGIKVDDLVGQEEVVIKSLGNYLGQIKGIAGSTIMGDGTVAMILDLSELVNKMDR